MAEQGEGSGGDAEDRTEDPSPRRLEKAREEGQVPLSREVVQLASLGAGTLAAAILGPGAARGIMAETTALLARAPVAAEPMEASAGLLMAALPVALGVAGAAAVAALAATLLQTGFLVSAKGLIPNLGKLNPLAGAKRLFGRHTLEELVRTLLKLGACVCAVWWGVWGDAQDATLAALSETPSEFADSLWHLLRGLLLGGAAGLAAVAGLDLLWVRLAHMRRLRMSREDLRQEMKESEGDPHFKAKRRHVMRQRSRRRALAEVPKATVVVTNPTHYAVALAYERGRDAAPRVVAKGADLMAKRIRETAEAHGVPLVPNPPLARALYLVDEEAQIPAEHFAAVAEVIAFVWRLKTHRGV
jgi:flagellar biosynthetic protein FlhB